MSFIYRLKNTLLKISPCFSPTVIGADSVDLSLHIQETESDYRIYYLQKLSCDPCLFIFVKKTKAGVQILALLDVFFNKAKKYVNVVCCSVLNMFCVLC